MQIIAAEVPAVVWVEDTETLFDDTDTNTQSEETAQALRCGSCLPAPAFKTVSK